MEKIRRAQVDDGIRRSAKEAGENNGLIKALEGSENRMLQRLPKVLSAVLGALPGSRSSAPGHLRTFCLNADAWMPEWLYAWLSALTHMWKC